MPETVRFFVLPNNTAGSVLIPITNSPQPIAFLTVPIAANEVVSLRATVGWVGTSGIANAIFKIWRGAPVTGTLINSSEESSESGIDRFKVTNLSHVDSGVTGNITYTLTAELAEPGRSANIIGPLTFTAATETVS